MTRKELDRYLKVIKTHRRMVREYRSAVSRLADGIAIDFSEGLEEAYVKLVAKLAGDTGRWIDWYIYENDFGRKKYEAGYDGNLKPIKSTRDLLNLIEKGKEKMNQALDITIKNLIRENYDLRCCENCCHIDDSYACYRDRHNAKEGFCCKEWEYDGRTIKERMKI